MDDGDRDPEAPENADDQPLLDLLDALVEERGRVPAAEALGVKLPHVGQLLRFPAHLPPDAAGAGGVQGRR